MEKGYILFTRTDEKLIISNKLSSTEIKNFYWISKVVTILANKIDANSARLRSNLLYKICLC